MRSAVVVRPLVLVLALVACGPASSSPGASPQQASEPRAKVVVDEALDKAAPAGPENGNAGPEPEVVVEPAKAEKKPSSVAQRWVAAHNTYRAKHCAAPLTWSTKLADIAQKWANTLEAKGCAFEHSPGAKYGENLAGGTTGALDPEGATTMWYDEIKKYNFAKGGFSMETGHFTQVVWKGTTRLGCAMAACPQWDLWVCNYDPPGNVERGYGSNVLSTGCK